MAAGRGGISPLLFYASVAVLLASNVVTGVGFLLSPDIADLAGGRTDAVNQAYADRITQLRLEVDRLHSRQYAQAGDLNLQLQELAQQQDVLAEQHQYVRTLAEKAAELGIAAAEIPQPLMRQPAPVVGASLSPMAYAALPAPAPVAAPDPQAAQVDEAARTVDAMMAETRNAMTAIAVSAEQSTDEIVTALSAVGLKPDLPPSTLGMGGPFVPADGELEGDVPEALEEANAVYAALARFKAARGALDAAPIHAPIAGRSRMSSNFGNRRDPFNGRMAFHAGIDFAMPKGTLVRSAGAGTVSFAGQRSGYGTVVEVTHANGLLTRYAHLSSISVPVGQRVEAGTPIGKVGSTGRSTGPHLHFEVHRKDKPLDPAQFIAAGRKLAHYFDA